MGWGNTTLTLETEGAPNVLALPDPLDQAGKDRKGPLNPSDRRAPQTSLRTFLFEAPGAGDLRRPARHSSTLEPSPSTLDCSLDGYCSGRACGRGLRTCRHALHRLAFLMLDWITCSAVE